MSVLASLRRHFSASAVPVARSVGSTATVARSVGSPATVVRSVGSPATVGSRVAAARSLSGCSPLRARFALQPLSRRSRKDATLSPCASFALCSLAFAQPFAPFAYAAARPRYLRLRCRPSSLPSPTLPPVLAPFAYAAARPRSLRLQYRPSSLPSLPTLQRVCAAAVPCPVCVQSLSRASVILCACIAVSVRIAPILCLFLYNLTQS